VSSTPPFGSSAGTSTRPYLIRALHEWCTDNGFTPYLAVFVDRNVQVPNEYVKGNEIVLNVGFEATSGLKLGNDTIEFKARFGGTAREIRVPTDHVIAIYARENGQGMAFPMPAAESTADIHPITVPMGSGDQPSGSAAQKGPATAGKPEREATGPTGVLPAPRAVSSAPEPGSGPPGGGPNGRPGKRASLKRVK
jgi:stringent starvation protein B